MKTCTKCGRTLPLTEFHRKSTGKNGRNSKCKECTSKYYSKYKKENPEKFKKKYKYNPEKDRERMRRYQENLRLKALYKLSDPPKCNNCGIEDIRLLDVDHINGGGTKERAKIGSAGIWRKILNMSVEEARREYQILCKNCNWLEYLNRKA